MKFDAVNKRFTFRRPANCSSWRHSSINMVFCVWVVGWQMRISHTTSDFQLCWQPTANWQHLSSINHTKTPNMVVCNKCCNSFAKTFASFTVARWLVEPSTNAFDVVAIKSSLVTNSWECCLHNASRHNQHSTAVASITVAHSPSRHEQAAAKHCLRATFACLSA